MSLWVSAALACVACAEPLEIPETPGAASPVALMPSRLEALAPIGWRAAGTMVEGRSAASATLLHDGRVLLAGGEGLNGILASAEVYEPSTRAWSLTGAMLTPRYVHTATLLPTGMVLVVGGWSPSGYLASAELYDPVTGRWTTTRSMSVARRAHTATLLPDGQVLIVGGYTSTGVTASAELYDPASGSWTTVGAVPGARYQHTATLLPTGKVLIAGGYNSAALASASLYDPDTRSWTVTGGLTTPCSGHTATLLPTGEVLVAGGTGSSGVLTTSQLYNPGTGSWSTTDSLTTARNGHTATLLPGGQFLVSGGLNGVSVLRSVELYDPALRRWRNAGSMLTGRFSHMATLLPSGQVLVAGGDDNLALTPFAAAELTVLQIGDMTAPDTVITSQPPNSTTSTSARFTFSSSETGATFECKLDASGFSACPTPITYTNLASGSHTFQVRARDAAGNVDVTPAIYAWTVDGVAPNTTITTQPPNSTNSTNSTFTFTSNETAVSFECKLDAAAFTSCTSPMNLTDLAEGSHTFQVRAMDAAGNIDASPASYTWFVDTVAPKTFITSPPPTSNNATFTFTSNEVPVSFECKLDAAAFTSCTSPVNLTGLAEGSHTFSVRARDAAGNVDPTPASVTWVVDTTAPDTTITAQPPNPSNSTIATFTFTSTDSTATFECKLDTGTFGACTSPMTSGVLSEGSHTFQVRAGDSAGNVDASPASYTWVVDTTAPDTIPTGQPPSPSNSPNATFTFTSTDSTATFECKLDAEAFTTCTSPKTYSALSEGSHTFQVRAKDAAGNVDSTPPSYSWEIDTTAPDTILTGHPPNPSNSTSATFTFSPSEVGTTFECKLDAEAFTPCTSPKTYSALAEDNHTFSVRAKDAAGNVDPTPPSYTWAVDTTAPDTTLTGQPPSPSNSPNATFTFTSTDSTAIFECKLDAEAFTTCTSPKTYSALADGNHTFSVLAKDAAGNVAPTPSIYSWEIDLTAPDTTLTGQPPNPSNSTSATFTFSPSEVGTTFECKLDAGAFSACTSPKTYSALADGSHTFSVLARDAAGNVDATPASYTWVVDTTVPDTTLTSQPPTSTRETSARFTFSSAEGSAFECSLDEAPFETCASPSEHAGLPEGAHTFQVRAFNAAGTVDPTPASHTWTVDLTAPETTLVLMPADPSHTDSATFSFTSNEPSASFECKLHEATDFNLCPSPIEYTGLTEGSHTFQVRSVDVAGNTDATPASFSWVVDARPPEAPIIRSPAQGATITQRQPSISGTAQPGSTVALLLDGTPLGTTTASSLGQWTFTPDAPLNNGQHTLTATARDGAGTSASSAPVSFTIEVSGPPDGGDDDPDSGGCGCGASSANASLLLWGLGLLATLGARRRVRPPFNHP